MTRATIGSAFAMSVQIVFVPLNIGFGVIADISVAYAFLGIGGCLLGILALVSMRHKRYAVAASIVSDD